MVQGTTDRLFRDIAESPKLMKTDNCVFTNSSNRCQNGNRRALFGDVNQHHQQTKWPVFKSRKSPNLESNMSDVE